MLSETIHHLNCRPGKTIADCTLGGCGHAEIICRKITPGGLLLGIDQDIDAVENAKKILESHRNSIRLFHGNFVRLPEFMNTADVQALDGILIDLGLSQHQLEASGRGFSFKRNEPLDMRMDIKTAITARDIVNNAPVEELIKIFKEFGEERWAKSIARKIAQRRRTETIDSSKALSRVIIEAIPPKGNRRQHRIHPATRVFMALRIAVNRELERLEQFLAGVIDLLNPKGRICVLSFHSLEDRIVKRWMKIQEKGCTCPPNFPKCVCHQKGVIRSLTKRVLRPTKEEIIRNPMARSTRLRAAEKL
jgi:16S rRNA (cytosine1402-N4)-methyltransferase